MKYCSKLNNIQQKIHGNNPKINQSSRTLNKVDQEPTPVKKAENMGKESSKHQKTRYCRGATIKQLFCLPKYSAGLVVIHAPLFWY